MTEPLLIADNLNIVNPAFRTWVVQRDAPALTGFVKKLYHRGIRWFDLMCQGAGLDPLAAMDWVIQTLQQSFNDIRFVLDTTDPQIWEILIPRCQHPPILNSLPHWPPPPENLEVIQSTRCAVIVHCHPPEQTLIPPQERMEIARTYYHHLRELGLPDAAILFDIDLFPLGTSDTRAHPLMALQMLQHLKKEFPGCYRMAALSNLTFRMENKIQFQAAFLSAAVAAGMNATMLNARSKKLFNTWHTALNLFSDEPTPAASP